MSVSLVLLAASAAVTMPTMPSLSLSQCDSPTDRTRILGDEATAGALRGAAADYNTRWEAALNAKMDALKMTPKERADLSLGVMKSPPFEAAMKAGFDETRTLMTELNVVLRSRDDTANCRSIVRMISLLPSILKHAETQWSLIDAALDAEAARRSAKVAE